jgi:cytochrome c-type biogenesis protein CcmF
MTDLGYVAIVLAFLVAIYGVVASVFGALRRLPELVASGRNAVYVVGGLVLLASIMLWRGLLTNQFQVEYVASHSERSLPTFYKFSAFWGGQAGSLTLWTLLLCAFAVAATWFFRKEQPSLRPYVNATLLLTIGFFCAIVIFAANPFEKLWRTAGGAVVTSVFQPGGTTPLIPADGQGLNPQLQNYWMVIHPIALYLGFVGMAVPFAFAVAALVTGQLGNTWIRLIRKWTLIPWLFLGVGIILGSQWAYIELGWGGYWAWDPVENASFLPWLTATAFVHSIMIQERRGMLKVWNVVLIWLTFELTLIGTFLTRSGVVESVHSFALSPIGPMLLTFIFATLATFALLLFWRLPLLRSENQLDGILSRETAFLTQNVVFVLIMLATLLGTLYRPISEILTGNKIALNAPYFQKVNGPLFLVLLILMAAAPLLAWRNSTMDTLRRNFAIPIAAAILAIPVTWLLGNRNMAGFVGFAVLAFVFVGIIQEFVRGIRARQRSTQEGPFTALVELMRRNGRRYGGYTVHIGILLIALAIIGNEFYQTEGQANLKIGESLTVANYTLTYQGLKGEPGPNYTEYVGTIDVARNGRAAGQMFPKKVVYNKNPDQPMTEVGLRPGPAEDVYIVLAGFDGNGETASFKVFINPLMSWMWAGALVLILGTLVALWPRRATVPVEARVRVPGGAQPAGGN